MFNITKNGLDAIGKELGVISITLLTLIQMLLKVVGLSLLIFTPKHFLHLQNLKVD